MEIYQGIFLGILQGLTEFLPVSSSGHLVLGQQFFGITEGALFFDISVHMGTLGAVVLVFYRDITRIFLSLAGLFQKQEHPEPLMTRIRKDEFSWMAVLIVAGSIPTAMIGLFLKQFEEFLFTSVMLVGFMLLLTGTILWVSRRFNPPPAPFGKFGIKKALFIGFIQGLAVIPGISRSGATIAAGLFAGLEREQAARFSFLLCIPAILGAQILGIRDVMKTGIGWEPVVLWGTSAAFISGYFALVLLLKIVKKGRFHLFAPYCWVLGVIALFSVIL